MLVEVLEEVETRDEEDKQYNKAGVGAAAGEREAGGAEVAEAAGESRRGCSCDWRCSSGSGSRIGSSLSTISVRNSL